MAERLRRYYFLLYVLYLLVGLLARWEGWVHFDQVWFVDAARHILAGSWRIYDFKASPDIAPPDGLAYSYSPLTAIIMAPFVGLADALGGDTVTRDKLATWIIAVPLLLADILAMEQLRKLVREWRPRYDERVLLLGVAASLFLGGFLVVSGYRSHQEGLILLFLILALRLTGRNVLIGGLMAGLALAAKHTAILELAAIGAVLIWPALSGERAARLAALRQAAVWVGAMVAVFGLIMLPSLLADAGAVWYAFFTQEARRGLLGPGLPAWIDRGLQFLLGSGPEFAAWHDALLRYSNAALIGAFGLLLLLALWRASRNGRPIGLRDSRLLALVALGALLQIVLAKWVSGHYYQLPLAIALLWDTVRVSPKLPLFGLGGIIAFRSVTQVDFPDAPPLRDGLIFAVFAWLTIGALMGAFDQADHEHNTNTRLSADNSTAT